MKTIIGVAGLLVAVTWAGIGSAREISNASLQRLMVLAGTRQEVQQWPAMARMAGEQVERQLNEKAAAAHKKPPQFDKQLRAFIQAMASGLKPSEMLSAIAKQVKHNVSEQDAQAMFPWLESPVGRRISKAEAVSSTPLAYRQMMASAKQLLAEQSRVQFALEQDKVVHITDISMQFAENLEEATFVATWHAMFPNQPMPATLRTAIKKDIVTRVQNARPRFERLTIISSVYAYRHIAMNNLQKYLVFLKTPAALRFNKSVMDGLDVGARRAVLKAIAATMTNDQSAPSRKAGPAGAKSGGRQPHNKAYRRGRTSAARHQSAQK